MLVLLAVISLAQFLVAFDFLQNDYVLEFERLEMVSYNNETIGNLNVVTWKYNRTQPVVNSTFEAKIDFENRLEIVVQGYKFMSNEYREFPMRFQFNMCQGLKSDLFGISKVYNSGHFPRCPMKKGHYYLYKWAPDQSKFPPHFPSGKYMWTFEAMYLKKMAFILKGYAEFKRPIAIPN